jgi:hypothetical protein
MTRFRDKKFTYTQSGDTRDLKALRGGVAIYYTPPLVFSSMRMLDAGRELMQADCCWFTGLRVQRNCFWHDRAK